MNQPEPPPDRRTEERAPKPAKQAARSIPTTDTEAPAGAATKKADDAMQSTPPTAAMIVAAGRREGHRLAQALRQSLAGGGAVVFGAEQLADSASDELRAEHDARALVTAASLLIALEILTLHEGWRFRVEWPVTLPDGTGGHSIERLDESGKAI